MKNHHFFMRTVLVLLTVCALLCGLCVPAFAEGKTYSIAGDDIPADILVAEDEGLTFNFGVYFQVKQAGTLTEVRRVFHGVEYGNFNVSVFRQTATVREYIWTGVWNVPEASGETLRWAVLTLSAAVRLEPGVDYCVCVETNETTTHYMVTENFYANASDEAKEMFIFSENAGRFAVGDGMKFPENVGANGRTFFVDFTFLPDSLTPAAGTETATETVTVPAVSDTETAAPATEPATAPAAVVTETATETPAGTETVSDTAPATEAPSDTASDNSLTVYIVIGAVILAAAVAAAAVILRKKH